jgi:hypothetical protein
VLGVTESGDIVLFEAKVKRWREALHQAYRANAFAHYVYVVLPDVESQQALANREVFERFGVGLCTVKGSTIDIAISAPRSTPFDSSRTEDAVSHIISSRTWPLSDSKV